MPTKTFTTGIPATNNNPSNDQPDMQVNNDSIASILGGDPTVDMIGFNDSDGGWHRFLTYIQQLSDPGSASGQYRQYNKAVSGSSELFAQKDGVSSPIQLTRGVPGMVTNANGVGYYSYLPGGLFIQWGSQTAIGNTATVPFPIAFTSTPTSVTGTVRNLTGVFNIASVQPPSSSGATFNVSGAGQTIYWIAIGT